MAEDAPPEEAAPRAEEEASEAPTFALQITASVAGDAAWAASEGCVFSVALGAAQRARAPPPRAPRRPLPSLHLEGECGVLRYAKACRGGALGGSSARQGRGNAPNEMHQASRVHLQKPGGSVGRAVFERLQAPSRHDDGPRV